MEGKGSGLGGGVFKKRLNDNLYRVIVLAKGDVYWVLEYLFAKKDADSIADVALALYRALAEAYARLTPTQLARLLERGDLTEICHESRRSQTLPVGAE